MSRFALLQQANAAPTHCRFCGEYVGPFIDTGCEEPNYGRIWVCAPIEGVRGGCVGSMAAAVGYHQPSEYAAQQQIIANLQDEIEAWNGRVYEISLGELSKMASNGTHGEATWEVTSEVMTAVQEPPYFVLDDVVDDPPVPQPPPDPEPPQPVPIDPEDMTKDALITRARELGIKPANKAMSKGELAAAVAAKED